MTRRTCNGRMMRFRTWIEGEEQDKIPREEAESFFQKVRAWASVRKNIEHIAQPKSKYYADNDDDNGFVLDAEIFDRNPKYKNLSIVITFSDKTAKAAYDPDQDHNWIILPLLKPYSYDYHYGLEDGSNDDPEELEYSLDRLQRFFVHEFTHYLDMRRYKDPIDQRRERMSRIKQHQIDGDPRYYLNPSEYNAFYQEAISMFMDHQWKHMDNDEKAELLSDFEKFRAKAMRSFDNMFLLSLTRTNDKSWYKRLLKRLYSLFEYLNSLPASDPSGAFKVKLGSSMRSIDTAKE